MPSPAFRLASVALIVLGILEGSQEKAAAQGLCAASGFSNGDFEAGFTGFSSSYGFSPGNIFPAASFDVTSNPRNAHGSAASYGDHTTGGGLMMAVNGAAAPGVDVWAVQVPVLPGTEYRFTAWVSSWFPQSPAVLDFLVNDVSVGIFTASSATGLWQPFTATWNSEGESQAVLRVVDLNTAPFGNDFALDDLSFVPLGGEDAVAALRVGSGAKNCDGEYELPIEVEGLSSVPISAMSFDLTYSEVILGAPVRVDLPPHLQDWTVVYDSSPADRLRVTVLSSSFPEGKPIADGELLRMAFVVDDAYDPDPPDFLPVPVFLDPDSIAGVPASVCVQGGFVTLGSFQTPKISVGSTSVVVGQEAVVPLILEDLCPTSPFGNLLPHEFYELEIEFGPGLQTPTASLETTVVSHWEFLGSGGGSSFVLQAQLPNPTPLEPADDLKDGVIALLSFPTTVPGLYGVRIHGATIQAVPTIVLDSPGGVEVKDVPCIRPEELLLTWDAFNELVESSSEPPRTTNRDCVLGHYSRFALYRDNLAGVNRLLVTEPLDFATRGTVQEKLIDVIAPEGADPACIDNTVLAAGWVSYADWDPLLTPGEPSSGKKYLFTTRNFPDDEPHGPLGRIENGSEFVSFEDASLLQDFFEGIVADKILPVPQGAVYAPNYPEPDSEFPGADSSNLLANGVGLWAVDAGSAYEYFNDPGLRRQIAVHVGSPDEGLTRLDGAQLNLFGNVGIYATSCAGRIAATSRFEPQDTVFQHSQLWGGAHVRAAGELIVLAEELCYIDDKSGHYRPSRGHFETFLESSLSGYAFEPIRERADGVDFTIPLGASNDCLALVSDLIDLPFAATLCLDRDYDPRTNQSRFVIGTNDRVRHSNCRNCGKCGAAGHYRLREGGRLRLQAPEIPREGDFRVDLQVKLPPGASDAVLRLTVNGRNLQVRVTAQDWHWTTPVTVRLQEGMNEIELRTADRVDVERVRIRRP